VRRTSFAIALSVPVIGAAGLGAMFLFARPAPDHPFFSAQGRRVDVISHRGGAALRPQVETLAERMQDQGLTTLGVSASEIVGRREGFHRGFETFVQVPGTPSYRTLACVRDGEFKYVLRLDDGSEELYDLGHDPGERVNRASRDGERRRRYSRLLRAWLASGHAPRMAWQDPGILERLRAVGYIR